MKNKKAIKIIVPLLILVAIATVWLIKNNEKNNQAQLPAGTGDFVLEVESLDMEAMKSLGLPMLLDFGGTNCPPCKQMAPDLRAVNEAMQEKALVKYLDAWKYPEPARDFPIKVVPTQVLINADGTPFVPSQELAGIIKFTMYSAKEGGEHIFTVHEGLLTREEMFAILVEMGVEE